MMRCLRNLTMPRGTLAVSLLLAGMVIGMALGGNGLLSGVGRAAWMPGGEPLIASAARSIGIKRCFPAINAVAKNGTTGATIQDIMVDWDHQKPDLGPMFSLTAMGEGTGRALLSLVAVPTVSGDCAILVEHISSTPRSCASVAANDLPAFPHGQLIDGVMVYQNPREPSDTYTLTDSDGGCLIVRRQAMIKWKTRG